MSTTYKVFFLRKDISVDTFKPQIFSTCKFSYWMEWITFMTIYNFTITGSQSTNSIKSDMRMPSIQYAPPFFLHKLLSFFVSILFYPSLCTHIKFQQFYHVCLYNIFFPLDIMSNCRHLPIQQSGIHSHCIHPSI